MRLLKILTSICLCLTLCSCWSYTELDKISMVSGIAIDKDDEENKYRITVETLDFENTGKDAAIASKTYEAKSNTIYNGFREMRFEAKKMYFGHCKIIIISEDVAREGISQIFDVLIRDHDVRITNSILIAQGMEAKDILKAKSDNKSIKAYNIQNILLINSADIPTYKVFQNLKNKDHCFLIPTIGAKEIKEETYKIMGSAYFHTNELKGFLNTDETKHYLLLTNKLKKLPTTYEFTDGNQNFYCAQIYDSDTKIDVEIKTNPLEVSINSKLTIEINEVENTAQKIDSYNVSSLENIFAMEYETRIKNLVNKMQNQFRCDLLNIDTIINEKNPDEWIKLKDQWDETFPNIKFTISTSVKIRNSGAIMIGDPKS